jgi:hypothetical protein
MKQTLEYFVESPHAAESRSEGNLSHGHSRFMNELLGKKHAPRLGNGDGRGSKVLQKQSPKLASPVRPGVPPMFPRYRDRRRVHLR